MVIDLEVAAGTPSPTIDPSVRVILIGHSMGGIVAADTLLSIASESPIPYSATSTPFPSSTTNASTTSQTVPPARPPSPPYTFMFPHIQGVLALDTPYLGISPGVIAHGAETHYQTASSAYSALSTAASVFGFGSGSDPSASPKQESPNAKVPAGALPPSPSSAKAALSASADAAAVPAWQKWGKYAMFAGAAGALAAGGAAAYVNRDSLNSGWAWATSHLEFVGCLMRGEELKTRMSALMAARSDRGVGFVVLYTVLGEAASREGASVAGGFIEIGARDGGRRTFCNLPAREEWKACFEPARNERAMEEVGAHMNMFLPRENPGYYALSERAKELVVRWVDQGWYSGSERKPEEEGVDDALLVEEETLAGEEPVLVG